MNSRANEKLEDKKIDRVYSWPEIYNLINEILNKKSGMLRATRNTERLRYSGRVPKNSYPVIIPSYSAGIYNPPKADIKPQVYNP